MKNRIGFLGVRFKILEQKSEIETIETLIKEEAFLFAKKNTLTSSAR